MSGVLIPNWLKRLFTILKNSPEYTEYLKKTGDTIQTDKDIIKFIFKKVILKSSLADRFLKISLFSGRLIRMCCRHLIAKTFKNFAYDEPAKNKLAEVTGNWEEDREFIVNLFEQTIRHDNDTRK